MYLRSHRLLHLQRVMELLATPMPSLQLRRSIAAPLLGLLEADFYASYVWDQDSQRFELGVVHNVKPVHGQRYEQCFQFDDPLTPRLLARRIPTRTTDVLSQRDLQDSAFFNDFLQPDGLYWGVNAYAHDGARHLGDLRIWRGRSRRNFDDDDLAILRLIYPALIKALSRGDGHSYGMEAGANSRDLLKSRLVQFATLSQREAEVAALACEGMADKDIARALGIAFTTVRTHLTAVFRKLDCDGRNQLAHLATQLPIH